MNVAERRATRDWEWHFAKCLLGAALAGQAEFERAEPFQLEGYQGLVDALEEILPTYREPNRVFAAKQIVAMYEAWGKPVEAAKWPEKTRPTP